MSIEAMKHALEKIANVNAMDYEYQRWAREALAIAEAEQEPVAWGNKKGEFRVHKEANEDFKSTAIPFYTHPQSLVGLTPEELSAIWDSMGTWNSTSAQHFYNAIWKAIKEKNNA